MWKETTAFEHLFLSRVKQKGDTDTEEEERHRMLLYELGLPGHLELRVHKPSALMGRHRTKDRHLHRPTTQTTVPVPLVLTALKVLHFFFHCLENTINRQLCYWYLQFVISFITEMQMAH